MKKVVSALCVAMSVLVVAGCEIDGADNGKAPPELVIVSEQISDTQRYDIDLTRDDAVYVIAPALDASRLTVVCPTRSTISFAEYIVGRIRPTGVKYDPARHILRLANAAIVSFDDVSQSGVEGQIAYEQQTCIVDCWDGGEKEQCNVCT